MNRHNESPYSQVTGYSLIAFLLLAHKEVYSEAESNGQRHSSSGSQCLICLKCFMTLGKLFNFTSEIGDRAALYIVVHMRVILVINKTRNVVHKTTSLARN